MTNEKNMKYALVTGAYGGMGRATIDILVQEGYCVFALDIRIDDLNSNDNVIWIRADIISEDALKSAFEMVCSHTNHLDAILHFAGIYLLDSLVEIDANDFDRIVSVNLRGAFLVNKIFLPLLNYGSSILMTTSELATLDPLPFTGLYAVTKAALDKYAYALRMELQLLGIRVSVLRAGAVETGMLGTSTDALDRFCKKTQQYSYNAKRFKDIVRRVEARCISSQKLSAKVIKILNKRRPAFSYSINRNPLLILLDCLPKRLQLWIIRQILK